MDSLFPQQRPGEMGARQSEAIISFKAGKCILSQRQSNGKFTVTPDKRRGTLSLSKSSDGLMNLRWSDRSTGILEDHRSIVPGEVTFKKCRTGRENDRVYLLQFTQAQQPLMFWMQEKSSEKDLENASKVNEYANNPAAADAAVAGTHLPILFSIERDLHISLFSVANGFISSCRYISMFLLIIV